MEKVRLKVILYFQYHMINFNLFNSKCFLL